MAQSIPETLGLARSIKQYSFGAPANGWTEEKADSERRTQRGVRNDNVLWEVGRNVYDGIAKNEATLDDHHTVLKIVLTLPVIEKYQNENMPDKNEIRNVIKEQERLIERTDSLTPKY